MTEQVQSPPANKVPGARRSSLRSFFVRGLILLLPTLITLWVLIWGLSFLRDNVVKHATYLIAWILTVVGLFPKSAYSVAGGTTRIAPTLLMTSETISWALCILLVVLVGVVFGSILGRRIWSALEKRLMRLPPMRFIYPYVKQITDFLFTERAVDFRHVVAVEYPRKGICSMGFVTGKAIPSIERRLNAPCVSVFIPSSPTPMTGYVIFVPESELVYLPLSIEEALKVTISLGVVKPELLDEHDDSPDLDHQSLDQSFSGSK